MPELTPHDVRGDLVAFVHALRASGVGVGTGQLIAYAEAAAALAPAGYEDLYWAGRAALVNQPSDQPTYDCVFRAWFHGELPEPPNGADDTGGETVVQAGSPDEVEPPSSPDDQPHTAGAVAATTEVLRSRRFDSLTEQELAAMRRLMARIDIVLPERKTRRSRPARRRGDLDLGRSLRQALRTDGEIIDRRWRRRRPARRRLVLLLDVSGSMAGFSRALLQFAFAARTRASTVEVFAFGTQLTRLTADLKRRDPDRAINAAAALVNDWDGGTRIGHAIETLNRRWGPTGLTRGAVVVICSDGLERDSPERLEQAMARLHRAAHAVVWVNPLKGDPRYEPAARGMAAALPHVDQFLAGHDLASLDALADVVARL